LPEEKSKRDKKEREGVRKKRKWGSRKKKRKKVATERRGKSEKGLLEEKGKRFRGKGRKEQVESATDSTSGNYWKTDASETATKQAQL
jgi:hypothetical protein